MGVPLPEMEPIENASAEALLDSLKTIDPGERRKHASVFNYWLSIRGDRQFPPIRDLDPLEISDAGPWSILLEMIGGGEDAIVRHFGQDIRCGIEVEKIGEAPNPSLLTCIHAKLPIVAACREAFAFEESFDTGDGDRRCWVTLLPFSANGSWIDFVYAYVSLEGAKAEPPAVAEDEPEASGTADEPLATDETEEPMTEAVEDLVAEAVEEVVEEEPEPFKVPLAPLDEDREEPAEAACEPEPEPQPEPVDEAAEAPVDEVEPELEPVAEYAPEPEAVEDFEAAPEPAADDRPSFTSKFMESLASVGGFYGKVAQSGPELPAESFVEESVEEMAAEPSEAIAEPASIVEGALQNKLTEVRALAEEAREAQIRSNMALYEGLSAAYDFALDAEGAPEDYLKLVEAQGLKIQLRSPMKPVVRLAFDGMCDDPTIAQLEAVLSWALKNDLPRGTLAERIEAEGGLGPILKGKAA